MKMSSFCKSYICIKLRLDFFKIKIVFYSMTVKYGDKKTDCINNNTILFCITTTMTTTTTTTKKKKKKKQITKKTQ